MLVLKYILALDQIQEHLIMGWAPFFSVHQWTLNIENMKTMMGEEWWKA